MEATAIHPFELAGLGKAPFRYVGMVYQEMAYGQRVLGNGATTKPGGTCAYCSNYIVNMFNVESADGRQFHVGCDCIRKVDSKLGKLADREIREQRKARKSMTDRDSVALARELLPHVNLIDKPHPNAYMAARGETLLSYVQFLLDRCGMSGQLKAAKIIADHAN